MLLLLFIVRASKLRIRHPRLPPLRLRGRKHQLQPCQRGWVKMTTSKSTKLSHSVTRILPQSALEVEIANASSLSTFFSNVKLKIKKRPSTYKTDALIFFNKKKKRRELNYIFYQTTQNLSKFWLTCLLFIHFLKIVSFLAWCRLCVCVTMKKVPDEWQARQAIPAILQVSSSKHNAKKVTARVRGPFHQSINAILAEAKREKKQFIKPTHVAIYLFRDLDCVCIVK